jgi:hypothetical protein
MVTDACAAVISTDHLAWAAIWAVNDTMLSNDHIHHVARSGFVLPRKISAKYGAMAINCSAAEATPRAASVVVFMCLRR